MANVFRRLYPYRDADALKALHEIWVTRKVMHFARSLHPEVYRRMRQFLTKTADEGRIRNTEMYNPIGEGIWEFKYRTTRIYSFEDGRRVVLTHGYAGKHLDRSAGERKVATQIRSEYLEWKGQRK